MGKKKTRVEAELRLKWLSRNEQGESPPKIAADDYDVRTVRKHIELARSEREVKAARAVVVRNALEKHYRAMVGFARRLEKNVDSEVAIPGDLREDPFWTALKQHQPHLPLWNLLARWDKILESLKESEKVLKARLEADLRADPRLKSLSASQLEGAVNGIVAALLFQANRWCRGEPGINFDDNFKPIPIDGGLLKVEYGAFHMGEQTAQGADLIKKLISDYQAAMPSWDEYQVLSDTVGEMARIKKKLHNELTVVIMKGVVPGKCKYCPI